MTRVALALLAALATLGGCEPGDVVRIANESGRGLTDVTLTVGEETFDVDEIPDGGSEVVHAVPRSDGHLTLCMTRGERRACGDYGYVTPGLKTRHHLRVTVDGIEYGFF